MVAIQAPSQSTFRRRIRGPNNPFNSNNPLSQMINAINSLPYLSQLSPADRLLLACGLILVSTVSFTYLFLLSNILSSTSNNASNAATDPRLSSEMRKMGLSTEELLRRGGGRRIRIGEHGTGNDGGFVSSGGNFGGGSSKMVALDSEENAAALDIISSLGCDALQDEVEREWKGVLDGIQLKEDEDKKWKDFVADGGMGDFGNNGDFKDIFGSAEVGLGKENTENIDRWSNGNNAGNGDGNERLDDFMARRRLGEEFLPDFDDPGIAVDDIFNSEASNGNEFKLKLTTRHLFCLVADALVLPKFNPADQAKSDSSASDNTTTEPHIHCDITNFSTRESLLYLWSSARSQIPLEILQKTLKLATEHKETLRGNEVHIWYPDNDAGTEGMLRVLNSGYEGRETYNFDSEPADQSHDDLYRFWDLPKKFLGPNKLFVDVGSALGLTSMLISYLYPQTTIVSIEPASPSWLLQNVNYRCNLLPEQLQYVHPILAGVGTQHHHDNDSMMKMEWTPRMTTATRNWSPETEFDFATDMELVVHLRTLRAILAEATPDDLPLGTPISVMNLDCEGCEYNLIPSLHESTFQSIGILLGRTNWGFIPTIKKPSSERGSKTHERVCSHYNFAKRCKECCEFPQLVVKPRIFDIGDVRGERKVSIIDESNNENILEKVSTTEKHVSDVAGALCDGFEEWAIEQHLHDIPDDFGWNEQTAFAAVSH